MTLYPNIIYHADTSTEIFIDTLQAIDNTANADVVTYQSSIDGSLGTFNRGIGARQLTLNGKISEDNETELRRQLQYLRGKQVYLMLGARNIATLARIKSFDMPVAVGTHSSLTLDVVAESETEGQFHEAEDGELLYSASVTSDTDASMGSRVSLTGSTGVCRFSVVQSDVVLPEGDYVMFARAKDVNQVTDDFHIGVLNVTDSTSETVKETLTSEYGIYTLPFTIDSDDAGDTMYFYATKDTVSVNTIQVDFLGFVRTD
jgi:hypothetical protein